jgi:chromosome partitioning protein
LQIEGILLTKYQSRTRLCREVSDYTRNNFGTKVKVFEYAVPSSIRMAELSSVGVSIFEHSPDSEAALAYGKLAEGVMWNV